MTKYTQITAQNLIEFPMGSKVRFNYGPMHGSLDAMIVDFEQNRWGVTLIAETESGERHHISGFTTIGIGCYLIETPPKWNAESAKRRIGGTFGT